MSAATARRAAHAANPPCKAHKSRLRPTRWADSMRAGLWAKLANRCSCWRSDLHDISRHPELSRANIQGTSNLMIAAFPSTLFNCSNTVRASVQ